LGFWLDFFVSGLTWTRLASASSGVRGLRVSRRDFVMLDLRSMCVAVKAATATTGHKID